MVTIKFLKVSLLVASFGILAAITAKKIYKKNKYKQQSNL
jgi:hypothetical protein